MKPRYYSGNALIIGGNRFVGKKLASEIVWAHRHNNVDVFNRSGTATYLRTRDVKGVSIIQGDRNDVRDLDKIDFEKYDYIVDMCLFFPHQLKLIMDSIKSKYIFVSSASVYCPPVPYRVTESYYRLTIVII